VLDALTQIGGFWHDDAQVCAGRLSKLYGGNIGVLIRIAAL
jgi:Holliday junction resolvase RusA-like endonuclease